MYCNCLEQEENLRQKRSEEAKKERSKVKVHREKVYSCNVGLNSRGRLILLLHQEEG